MEGKKTLAGPGEAELVERKSRFIGYAMPIADEAAALDFLNEVKAKHRDATHHVYAFQAGEQNEIMRSSDDGEPAGTAGRPVLEVIKKESLSDTAVVVVRYFGGVLLGAGGLVRAYGKSAAQAIAAAGMVWRVLGQGYSLSFDYGYIGKVQSFLAAEEYQTDNTLYLERVTVFVTVEKDRETLFLKELQELSAGAITAVPVGGPVWIERKIESK